MSTKAHRSLRSKLRWAFVFLLVSVLAGCQSSGGGAGPTAFSPPSATIAVPVSTPPVAATPTPTATSSATPPTILATASATPVTPTKAPTALPTATLAPHAFTPLCNEAVRDSQWPSRLLFQGRVYARVVEITPFLGRTVTTPPSPPAFTLGAQVGRVFAPWQAGDTLANQWHAPSGAPIRTLQGIPPEAMLAVEYDVATDLFCAVPYKTPLAETWVVRGRVTQFLLDPYCEFSRCHPSTLTLDPRQTVAVTVSAVWQGNLTTDGKPLTVITLPGSLVGGLPRLALGQEVLLFLRPQETLEDYYPPRLSGVPPELRQPIWVAEAIGIYTVEGETVRWLGDRATAIPLADFQAGVAGLFLGVTPADPPAASPRP